MTTKTIDCVDCGEPVPHGRLSCPACGALLASVAGGRRPSAAAAEPAGPKEPAEVAEPAFVPAAWPPLEDPEPAMAARPYERYLADEIDAPVHGSAPPSAYRPPAVALSVAVEGGPSWPSASASVGAGAPRAVTLDAARSVEIADWFVIVGGAMSALGFLLPWSSVVIGARSFGGYFDTWGLASPTHIVVLAAILTVLGLAIARAPVPAWLRSGVLGLALGSLLIGLAWPYLVGPLGADVGVTVVALGGLALIIGGVLASWATRHAEVEPLV